MLREVVLRELMDKLISDAVTTHGRIFPCGEKSSFYECFTIEGERIVFWYDTDDGSTHVETVRFFKEGLDISGHHGIVAE